MFARSVLFIHSYTMARSTRFAFAVGLYSMLALTKFTNSYDCSYVNNANWCTVSDVAIQSSDDVTSVTFPNVSQIYLKQPSIDYLSPEVVSRMIAVDQMEVDAGTVPRIYIKPSISRISAHNNQVREVVIDPKDNYYLEHLGIAHNRLRRVPKNINYLKHLVRLHLHDNEIETVNMDLFKNLTRLKVLALHRNKIHHLDTTVSLKLTNLVELHLYGNQLEELFVSLWDFPNLETLHLASNKFRSIGRFPEHFARLTNAALGGNRWNCAWLVRSLVPALKQGDLKVTGDKQCLDSRLAGICCDGKPEDFGGYLVEYLNEAFQRINVWMIHQQRSMEAVDEQIEAVNSEMMSGRSRHEEKFVNLEEQVDALEDLANRNLKHLKADLQRIERNNPKQVLEQFELFKEKLTETRALMDDIVQEMYVEEMRKQGINM